MALDATKWQVRTDKSIRYIGPAHEAAGANYVTVLELHRWLMDLADDASTSNDDYMDITTVNPSDKKFDTIITLTNSYTLDDVYTTPASQYIYGGSIIQGSGGTEKIYDGINVVANRGVIVNVIQNDAVLATKFWNSTPNGESFPGLNPDPANGIAMRFMVKVKDAGAFIDNGALLFTSREEGKTYSEFRIPATGRGVNVVPLTFTTDLNNTTPWATVSTWTTIANLKEGYSAIDVDQNSVDEYYYSKWDRNTTVSYTINQFYERMKWLTRNGETTTIYGLAGEKFRGITHELTVSQTGGTYVEPESLSWSGGTGQLLAVDSTTAATKIYMQLLTGTAPSSGTVTGNGGATATVSANAEKAVSAPFCGQSTGSSIVGAYGFSLEYPDLAVNDKITAFDGTTRSPPNNVTFTVGGLQSGWRVLVGPEDGGGGLLYTQLSNTNLLSSATVTTVEVDEAIPANTPTASTLRIARNDGSYTRHPYSSVNTGTKIFTLGTASTGSLQLNVDDVADTFTRLSGDFIADGFVKGMRFTTAGFTNPGNNAQWTVASVTTTVITVTVGTGLVTETGTGDESATSDGHDFSTNNAAIGNNIFIAYIDATSSGTSINYNTVQTAAQTLYVEARFGGTGPNYTDAIKPAKTTGDLTSTGGSATISSVSDA